MTVYYRQSADAGDMKPRPTLDHLRDGRGDGVISGGVEEVSLCVTQHICSYHNVMSCYSVVAGGDRGRRRGGVSPPSKEVAILEEKSFKQAKETEEIWLDRRSVGMLSVRKFLIRTWL